MNPWSTALFVLQLKYLDMKLINPFLILLLAALWNPTMSQYIEFEDLVPAWSYTFEENNTPQGFRGWNVFAIEEHNAEYFLIGSSIAPTNYDWYGTIINCLNASGKKKWNTTHQTFLNNDSIHVFFPNYTINSSNIELFGYKRKYDWSDTPGRLDDWALYGAEEMYPYDLTLSTQDGNILSICETRDTITYLARPVEWQTFQNGRLDKIKTNREAFIRPDSMYLNEDFDKTLGFNFFNHGDSCSFSKMDILDTIMFLPNDTVGPFSTELHPLRIQPDPNTLLINLWFERYSNNPRQYLLWIDIGDINDIKLIEMQELSEYIPISRDRWITLRIRTKNEQVYLSHSYQMPDGTETAYLLWLDNNRKVKKAIAPCEVDGHHYQVIELVHADNNELLCLGAPSVSPKRGYDLLRVKESLDTLEFIGSIVPKREDIYYNFLTGTASASGEEIVIGMEVFQVEGITKINARTEVHSFRIDDFITNSLSPKESENTLHLFPNPATDLVKLKLNSNIHKVYTISLSGQEVPLNYQRSTQEINIGHLPRGIYTLVVQDNLGKSYVRKLIKQ